MWLISGIKEFLTDHFVTPSESRFHKENVSRNPFIPSIKGQILFLLKKDCYMYFQLQQEAGFVKESQL